MARVVIFMAEGAMQGILTDSWLAEVIIMDRDLEGVEKGDPGLKTFDGEIYYVGRGVDLVDPDYVTAIFQALEED